MHAYRILGHGVVHFGLAMAAATQTIVHQIGSVFGYDVLFGPGNHRSWVAGGVNYHEIYSHSRVALWQNTVLLSGATVALIGALLVCRIRRLAGPPPPRTGGLTELVYSITLPIFALTVTAHFPKSIVDGFILTTAHLVAVVCAFNAFRAYRENPNTRLALILWLSLLGGTLPMSLGVATGPWADR